MNTPPLLLSATLLFWGWQIGLWPVAAVMAVLLEGARLTPARWEFSQPDLDRIWNVCTLLFLGVAVYGFTAGEGIRARGEIIARSSQPVFQFFQWIPFYFFPIMAVQAWNQRDTLPLSTFSWWLRRKRVSVKSLGNSKPVPKFSLSSATTPPMHAAPERGLNISYPYFCLCLLGASAARARAGWFLGGLLLLLGWALWTRRSRSRSPVFWMASLLLAAGLGLAAQQGLISLQGALQRLDTALMLRFGQAQFPDANESRTMIGAVGKVKLSGRIMLRVNSGDRSPPPLLREASYNLFKSPVWGCAKRDFRVLAPEIDQSTWKLVTNQTSAASVTITELLPGGKGLLALPQGVLELEKLPVFLLESNPLGAVRSSAGPGFVEFNAGYGRGASIDEPPGPDDLQTPTGERQALAQIAAELELEEKTPEEILRSVAAFFMQRFEYSAWLGDSPARGGNPTAIKNFLLRSRKGHCEYFATATTLLLREAGIPARYAVGYAVQERRGGEYLVRARHAHAWCLAYVNGVWREVDTTPASWAAVEAGRASFWEPLSDAWSRGWFSFSKWRFGHSQSRKYLIWLIALPLLGALARLLCAPDWRRVPKPGLPGSKLNLWAGRDSEFYLIEARLAQLGWARQVGETSLAWLRRITATGIANPPGLEKLLALHYRLRFDPDGLVSSDRAELAARAGVWLKDLEGATAHKMALSEHDPTG